MLTRLPYQKNIEELRSANRDRQSFSQNCCLFLRQTAAGDCALLGIPILHGWPTAAAVVFRTSGRNSELSLCRSVRHEAPTDRLRLLRRVGPPHAGISGCALMSMGPERKPSKNPGNRPFSRDHDLTGGTIPLARRR
jgi:hypothetical protein